MAPPPTSSSNSMVGALQKVLGDIGAAMALPDADLPFLQQLQQVIVAKIHSSGGLGGGLPNQPPPNPLAPGGPPTGGGPPMGGPGGPPMGPPGVPGLSPMSNSPSPMSGQGVMPAPSIPNVDELRRLLSSRVGG